MTATTVQEGQAQLPSTESTRSFWHQNPSQILKGHRTTDDLPHTADVVVVGSGIAGAFAARELVAKGRKVVMLEAREACWGATGRNGGHCQPRVYGVLPHIARFEQDTYKYIRDMVADNNIPCNWATTGMVESLNTDREVKALKENLELLKKHHPDLADQVQLFTEQADLDRLRVPNAVAATLRVNAAKVWPYKLVSWILEQLVSSGVFNLQTTTPVTHVQKVSDQTWAVHTDRGQILTRNVVLATNGYTSHLLPKMTGLITPIRGQVCALRPPDDAEPTPHTHGWVAKGQEDYFIEIGKNNTIIFGGERLSVPGGGEGISADDEIDDALSENLRRACGLNIKLRPKGEEEPELLHAEYEWTGIMGFSKDSSPWVGEVPECLGGGKGLWICAGFTGHGMPVAARCAVAMAERLLGGQKTVELPKEFVASEERVSVVRADTWTGDYIDEFEREVEKLRRSVNE